MSFSTMMILWSILMFPPSVFIIYTHANRSRHQSNFAKLIRKHTHLAALISCSSTMLASIVVYLMAKYFNLENMVFLKLLYICLAVMMVSVAYDQFIILRNKIRADKSGIDAP